LLFFLIFQDCLLINYKEAAKNFLLSLKSHLAKYKKKEREREKKERKGKEESDVLSG
jgi:ABC-type lipoprotein export system ATPase subunit